ncbi:MAG: type IV toxin-antitoxin system AbiEi family antitoxin domain-containing protein [Planctomycetota bacterium]|jgi:predicted transcriptional regulator of viral defense system
MNRLTEHFFKTGKSIFGLPEVTVLIDGSNYSRHGLIKRAMVNGEIQIIRRGLYCLTPEYQKKPISVCSLSQSIYGPSYVSLETALRYHDWIPEAVYGCTCVSFQNSKEFKTPFGIFSYKRVPQKTFYASVERCIDENGNPFFMASPAKAISDYVYVHNLRWTGISDAVASLRIEQDELDSVTFNELSDLKNNYNNGRVKQFLAGWQEALK